MDWTRAVLEGTAMKVLGIDNVFLPVGDLTEAVDHQLISSVRRILG